MRWRTKCLDSWFYSKEDEVIRVFQIPTCWAYLGENQQDMTVKKDTLGPKQKLLLTKKRGGEKFSSEKLKTFPFKHKADACCETSGLEHFSWDQSQILTWYLFSHHLQTLNYISLLFPTLHFHLQFQNIYESKVDVEHKRRLYVRDSSFKWP